VSNAGIPGNRLESVEEFSDPTIRGFDVVLGNVFPNLVEVQLGRSAENVLAHALSFLRSRDFCSKRCRAASGEPCSPRSSEARRAPNFVIEGGKLRAACAVMLLKKAQGFADHFAGRVIAAGLDLSSNESIQFGRQRNIHREMIS